MKDIKVLINEQKIEERITEIAKQIEKDYEGTESTNKIKLNKDISGNIEGRDVIIVEDIIDTGRTLSYLTEYLKSKNVKSLKIATMLSKPSRRVIDINVDYIGFEIDDIFVIGYGLDYDQKFRNLPYIGYIE